MRIVQLSDIHLSKLNLEDFRNYYLDALLCDLKTFNNEKKIDVILFTGDLVDKGGDSIGTECYDVFRDEFISPLIDRLPISKDKILFIPGNHDVNREQIDRDNEYYLVNNLTKEKANEELKEIRTNFNRTNNRIKKFKEFEKVFHLENHNYLYSNNESLAIDSDGDGKVGFALINDSWRCSSALKQEQHFIGFNQLFNANKYFKENKTDINIAVFHHPLEALNVFESEEIDNILKSQNFDIAIFGHSHEHKFESLISANGGFVALNGRSAFNNPSEKGAKYQPGYNILDIDLKSKSYKLFARKFIKSTGYRFDKDVDSLPDGVYEGSFDKRNDYFKLNTASNNVDDELPSGYSADVNRIVKLLIGKSLYPHPFIFVRELIQNSVDACNRVREKNTHLTPEIRVNINTDENYFEIADEGDGMTKKILKEHFAVIGKSISQEFNDSNGNFNLISQFGIGFISTFIVAQKVYISTKSDSDELVNFEIVDVFKGFNYNVAPFKDGILKSQSGTLIRVYLKKEYDISNVFSQARSYCRHIDNIQFYIDSVLQQFNENWNTDDGIYKYNLKNSKYEIKLVFSNNAKNLISCNSGFLINTHSTQLIPYRFPYMIGGEVNFKPKSIDFDLSRSNIIESSKSQDFKKEISLSLRNLFRQVLESEDQPLKEIVLGYLQFYLCNYETNQTKIAESYADFYSKKELVKLCIENMFFDFEYQSKNLLFIVEKLKSKNINRIYYNSKGQFTDYEAIVVNYLRDSGNFVVVPQNTAALFRDGHFGVSAVNAIQIIAQEYSFNMVDINQIEPFIVSDLKMNKAEFSTKIFNVFCDIESENDIKIDVTKFNRAAKPVIKLNREFFINYEHSVFQSLLNDSADLSEGIIKAYILGLLDIKLADINPSKQPQHTINP